MPADMNRQWRVARYPAPDELIGAEHFRWHEEDVPRPAEGEFLVRTICLAPGPAQRAYLDERQSDSFDLVPLDAVMRGRGVGQVVESRHPDYHAGDIFVGSLGWQDYSLQRPRGAEFVFSTKKVRRPVRPLSTELSILGQAGATAYFGLLDVGRMQSGDNVLVSAAAGGVGSCVGQIARIRGAGQVVGLAGTDRKCRWLVEELGFSAAINHKSENVGERIAELFPDGIDVFFDNVGGEILNAALDRLAMHARVVLCGFIATNYAPEHPPGPSNYHRLIFKRARMQGFIVFDYWNRFAEAEADLHRWFNDGRLRLAEDVSEGLENMPAALRSLFTGGNTGVAVCRVRPDPAEFPGAS